MSAQRRQDDKVSLSQRELDILKVLGVDRPLEADHFRGLRGGQRELPGATA